MKATWPGLAPRKIDRRLQSSRWVGRVRAQYCWYTIEIRYRVGSMPEVRVLAPTLVRLPDNEEGALPHVYPPADDPTLCLFDPRTGEWDASMPLAQTIIPWTLDWLSCYELWLMTGKWTGGGRHVCDPVPISMENLQ
ncbi:hypothetical protein EOA46_33095 [Mesorhizobium sp. M1A.F.Ca.IN.022.05.2.1]|nr:hypothetical protein EOA46_33095 [Mesorhizobium sp. M1A.F.Ca.IN.022.05.2.1]RWF83220.1 MAG: hypothetical protein EOQ35_07090 [Mesorhizobium sp.]RWG06754.1 MAG: hypothetical protein EOQ38_01135 [Mesorhizobium sp.]RWG84054.1 MAG: hypothetical protein EOQ68_14700 [Mesorhizobium sp.]RWH07489.1 MAG: hypothetical protein EOQ73_01800 [Mesorhizobium sp.]